MGGHTSLALGVCYYPEHWPESLWQQDAEQMAGLGLRYVRIGEFAWSRLEPMRDQFDFGWLDRAITVLAEHNLKVVLCTPTATPPKWLIDEHPDILPVSVKTGATRGFGSRRHYDFSSDVFREEAIRITEVLAQRYGNDSRVVGWQVDNELCCHDTAHSASPAARAAFQTWCRDRYGTIDALNKAWGTVFWSMEYRDFASIELPVHAVTETNPAHQLAYRRFSSDQVIRFHDACVAALRTHISDQWVTHNFIPMKDTQTDCFALSAALDFVSYDSYPLGRTEFLLGKSDPDLAQRYMRTGHPDYTAYYLDQSRGLKGSGFWIMEQQPGPVNWAPANPRPAPGMITLWSLEAFAHGADVVSYFRWRQAPFAQEQMHAGLMRPDHSTSDAWLEVERVQTILSLLVDEDLGQPRAQVALVVDVQSQWVAEIEQQGQGYDTNALQFQWYSALRRLGVGVDAVSADNDLSGYALVLVPSLPILSQAFKESLASSPAIFLLGPRFGAKTPEFSIPETLPPGDARSLTGFHVLSVETLRPDVEETLQFGSQQFASRLWCEDVEVDDASVLATYQDTRPALLRRGNVLSLTTLTCDDFLTALLTELLSEGEIDFHHDLGDCRLMARGSLMFAFNYDVDAKTLPVSREQIVFGSHPVPPRELLIWRR